MKKLKLLPVVFLVLLFGSCKKDNSLDVPSAEAASIITKSAAEQVKYAEVNLGKIAKSMALLTKNTAFVSFVHQEIAMKRDGQFEVLIERLQKDPVWGSLIKTKEINEGLAAFKNLGGQNLYPQIYIPKMQHDEEVNTSNSTSTVTDVKVAIYGGEVPGVPAPLTHPSFSIDNNGALVPFQNIDEQYADENEVWVFSINEVITTSSLMIAPGNGDCGPSSPEYPECTYGSGGGGGSSSSTGVDDDPTENLRAIHPAMNLNNPVNIKIQNMIVHHHKESWLGGDSEVAMRAALNTINGRKDGNPTLDYWQYKVEKIDRVWQHKLGRMITQATGKQIRNGHIFQLNYELQAGWPTSVPASDPVYFDYVIFERDLWPFSGVEQLYRKNNINFFGVTDNEGYYCHSFRSANDAYDINRIVNNTSLIANGTSTPCIYYNNGSSAGIDNSISFNIVPY